LHFATLSGKTYALRATDGKLVWRKPMGKYSPVIATEKTYFFALNGRATGVRSHLLRVPAVRQDIRDAVFRLPSDCARYPMIEDPITKSGIGATRLIPQPGSLHR
jgi:hypothetical protein